MKFQTIAINLKDNRSLFLRSVKPDDASQMLDHLVVTHSESYKNMNQNADFWKTFPVEKEAEILGDFLDSANKFMMVATFENRIVGGLGFVGSGAPFQNRNGNIGMSVQLEFANSGLGTAMMKLAIQIAREASFHRMELSVRTYNQAGIALYEKMGFQRVGTLREIAFVDDQYVDEYAYELIL